MMYDFLIVVMWTAFIVLMLGAVVPAVITTVVKAYLRALFESAGEQAVYQAELRKKHPALKEEYERVLSMTSTGNYPFRR